MHLPADTLGSTVAQPKAKSDRALCLTIVHDDFVRVRRVRSNHHSTTLRRVRDVDLPFALNFLRNPRHCLGNLRVLAPMAPLREEVAGPAGADGHNAGTGAAQVRPDRTRFVSCVYQGVPSPTRSERPNGLIQTSATLRFRLIILKIHLKFTQDYSLN